jgi:hypothetical protein
VKAIVRMALVGAAMATLIALGLGNASASTLDGVGPASVAKPATEVSPLAWSDCPASYSCYYAGLDGAGKPWLAPACGADYGTTFWIRSVYNRGGNTVYVHDASWSVSISVPVGYIADIYVDLNHVWVPC